ncbi:MAG: terminase, partial [Patescibacteria group bacterium]|nr:terminase [Patescibacteria group bacterium]
MKLEHHLNLKIKRHGIPQQYTQEEVEEYFRCSQDPVYFIEKYVKINTIDSGVSPFILRGYQKSLIEIYHKERKVIVLSARQSGKTITTAAYILWYICFNP